jgi:alkylation response protein AidB-like acyl-CoA dehydrogenase
VLEVALEALGGRDSVRRARVLASLVRALIFAGREERGTVLGRAAIETARRIGDTSALLTALKAVLFTTVGPELLDERLAYATKMLQLAQQSSETEKAIQAHIWRVFCLLEVGDIRAVDAELEVLTRLADELGQPFYLSTGAKITPDRGIHVQLASCHAIETAGKVVDLVHSAVGTTGIRNEHRFQQYFRDVHTVSQHAFGSPERFESVGKLLLGKESDSGFFYL